VRVEVVYNGQVSAFVETETGTVERVVVHDTSLGDPESVYLYAGAAPGDFSGPYPVDLSGDKLPRDRVEEATRAALGILEEAEWPSWEIGE
jgi:hypothetical protein